MIILLAVVVVWALISLIRSYPSEFYPRFYDEAIYAMDVRSPGALLSDYTGKRHFAPFKLGYGLPLAAAYSLFGENGIMYFSTLCWALTIIILALVVYRRFGAVAAAFLSAFLAYSPFLGKSVAEAAPTTLAALLFACLWWVYRYRQYLLTGLVVGLIALVDFKWALPTALSVAVIELAVERHRSWVSRLGQIGGVGLTAIGLLAFVSLVHPAFYGWLTGYVRDHSGRVLFLQPSLMFAYRLYLFGAAPVAVLTVIALVFRYVSDKGTTSADTDERSLLQALVIGGAPILFYSLFGEIKALRFFAVTFPVLAVVSAVSIRDLIDRMIARVRDSRLMPESVVGWVIGLVLVGVIVIGSDGPARHLQMSSGYELAIDELGTRTPRDGSISSYMWPVAHYGWQFPLTVPPNATWGLLNTDKWLLLDPAVDRAEISLYGQPDADSLWTLRGVLQRGSDSLFSVPSEFYASKYFIAEHAGYDIAQLHAWLHEFDPATNYATVYRINLQKLQRMTPR